MRVAFVHYTCPPVVGGVERILGAHARLAAAAGHDVRVVAGRGAPFDDRVEVCLLPLADSRHPRVLEVKRALDRGEVPPEFDALAGTLEAVARAALSGTEVVVLHNVASLSKNLALTKALHRLAAEQPARRWILWHHDLAWSMPRYRPELHDGEPWDLLRKAWPGAQQVAISEARAAELAVIMGIDHSRIRVVPDGIDTPESLALPAGLLSVLRVYGIGRADPLLLSPVRVTPRKNLGFALEILAAIRTWLPDAGLVVTGPPGAHDPGNLSYLRQLEAERDRLGLGQSVWFLGSLLREALGDPEVAGLYRFADALLLPSLEEGFGLPLLEAGAARLPVFAADLPVLREIGGNDVSWFQPAGDPAEVAAMIAERLASDPAVRLARRVRRNYSDDRIWDLHLRPLIEGSR